MTELLLDDAEGVFHQRPDTGLGLLDRLVRLAKRTASLLQPLGKVCSDPNGTYLRVTG
jgi:hypothetical protein